jgi:hypothetical protein
MSVRDRMLLALAAFAGAGEFLIIAAAIAAITWR